MNLDGDAIAKRCFEDGRILELWPMLYNLRITVSVPENYGIEVEDAWCYKDPVKALQAFATWDGEGEPPGWNKHPMSGRWREDGTPATEINQRDER